MLVGLVGSRRRRRDRRAEFHINGAAKAARRGLRPRREVSHYRRRTAHPVITAPSNPVAVLREPHAARLGVEPLEPLLTELAFGYPPPPAIRRSAKKERENAGLARHEAVGLIGDWDGNSKRCVEVNRFAGERLF